MSLPDTVSDRKALARDAVIWGLPLVLFGRYLDAALANGVAFNRFYMSMDLASPQSRAVGPNIDTLNGRAWIDLGEEPQVIGVPDTADRYYTIQLQDMYMNSFAYIGRRTTGTGAGHFVLTPPGYAGAIPPGMTEVRAPTTRVLAFVRTLVRGRDDLPAVRAINGQFTLGPLSGFPDGQVAAMVGEGVLDAFQPSSRRTGGALPHIEIARSGAAFFGELDRLVKQYPPLPADAPNLPRFAPLDIGAGEEAHADIAGEVEPAVELVTKSVRSWSENGWLRRSNVARFITDPLERAANHLYGPGTQVAEESVFYNLRTGPDGETLNGANIYRLRFAPGELPPVDAFWSLTLYDGSYFLFDNPIDRYGVNDRTEGLSLGPDGSLEILVQAVQPADPQANWLPAPSGDFQLVFRTYQPRRELLEGNYRLPPLELVGQAA